jgi:hypothetical protein
LATSKFTIVASFISLQLPKPHRDPLEEVDRSTTLNKKTLRSTYLSVIFFSLPYSDQTPTTKMSLTQKLTKPLIDIFVLTWDFQLFLLNLLLPAHAPTDVVPAGVPGHAGHWGTYVPPKDSDSRSACPMLNALANHGILPHDGKSISFRRLNTVVRQSFNFAPSFCFFVPTFAANFLSRSYWTDSFDLAELSMHNAIEHDASLTRQDVALVPDQGKPDLELVQELLEGATGEGGKKLTKADLSRALAKRRQDAKRTNEAYSESLFHNGFGSAK